MGSSYENLEPEEKLDLVEELNAYNEEAKLEAELYLGFFIDDKSYERNENVED